jgi:uncharacterized protein (TIGR02996 family)
MTTEDDFQQALDASPEDHQTRLVFADWLQERCDPRAEGYRAMGLGRAYPISVRMAVPPWRSKTAWIYGVVGNSIGARQRHCLLSVDWFKLIERGQGCGETWRRRLKRREAEDAAALAFAELPPERRAELLAATPVKPKRATRTTPAPPRSKARTRKKPAPRKGNVKK